MKNLVLLFAISIMIMAISCKEQEKKNDVKEGDIESVTLEKSKEPKHWSYDGETSPDHWAEIEKESSCGGNHQSPIDIVSASAIVQASGLIVSDINYDESITIHDVTNNGHSVQYNFEDKHNYVDFAGKRYNLIQFHFHAASEHTINGKHFPLVIHMVHVSEDKEFVVFAIMVSEGDKNETLDFIETYLPINPGETKAIGKPHNFTEYLVGDFDHLYYKGSLTTPPCTEAVNWFLFKDDITASPAQIKAMADLMPINNFRPTQPLNDRKIYLSK